jgi:hypothetical protein
MLLESIGLTADAFSKADNVLFLYEYKMDTGFLHQLFQRARHLFSETVTQLVEWKNTHTKPIHDVVVACNNDAETKKRDIPEIHSLRLAMQRGGGGRRRYSIRI